MMGWTIFGFVVLGIAVIAALYFAVTYNRFMSLRNRYEEAFATVDVYCKKRYDLIPNLVETVKGYAAYEEKTLMSVITARSNAMNSKGIAEQQKNDAALEGALKSLFALAESYPELKANQGFLDLQSKLSEIEAEIAESRKYYNAVIKTYNTSVETIPSSIIAGWCRFEKQPYYEIVEAARENVKVSF
jgi:LemA protein